MRRRGTVGASLLLVGRTAPPAIIALPGIIPPPDMLNWGDRIMASVRPPAVAGSFYPADPQVLRRTVGNLLDGATRSAPGVVTRFVVVPHAGYQYSGIVAASAYRLVRSSAPRRAVLLGPSHFVGFDGLAIPGAEALASPLGDVPVDHGLTSIAEAMPPVHRNPDAHAPEHSLEVQLPFLQVVVDDFSVLALLTGSVGYRTTADVLEAVTADPDVVGVISSDLSHYLTYEAARRRDAATTTAISDLRPEEIGWEDACGRTAVQAALEVARRRGWTCRLLDHRNSGDTAGPMDRVVGYAAFAIGPEA